MFIWNSHLTVYPFVLFSSKSGNPTNGSYPDPSTSCLPSAPTFQISPHLPYFFFPIPPNTVSSYKLHNLLKYHIYCLPPPLEKRSTCEQFQHKSKFNLWSKIFISQHISFLLFWRVGSLWKHLREHRHCYLSILFSHV